MNTAEELQQAYAELQERDVYQVIAEGPAEAGPHVGPCFRRGRLQPARTASVNATRETSVATTTDTATRTYKIDKAHSEVIFQIRHLVTKVRGRFDEFDGTIQLNEEKPELSSVEFTIKAASIDTNEKDRDTHLRSADFFDVEKFPDLTFRSKRIVKKGPRELRRDRRPHDPRRHQGDRPAGDATSARPRIRGASSVSASRRRSRSTAKTSA